MPNTFSEDIKDDALRLRTLIDMASDGIITIDHRGHIESVNSAASNLFGYSSEEMIGQKINMLMTSPDREQHDQYLLRYQHTREARIIGIGREVSGQKKDGTIFPLRLAVSEVNLNGKTIYTGILHDITKEKRAQSEILQLNNELERKVLARTEELGKTLEKMLTANEALNTEMRQRREVEQKLRKRE
ncbi:MAG: PAS domain S-box protein, partial [Bacteroidota bacterium]